MSKDLRRKEGGKRIAPIRDSYSLVPVEARGYFSLGLWV